MTEMELFIKGLSENVFSDTSTESLGRHTEYMDLEEWTSMTAFTLISYIDEAYGKKLQLPELLMAQTIEDLFHVVNY